MGELVDGVLDAIRADAHEVYVPAWFKDIVITKAGDLSGFLAGSAEFVRSQGSYITRPPAFQVLIFGACAAGGGWAARPGSNPSWRSTRPPGRLSPDPASPSRRPGGRGAGRTRPR